MDQKCDMFTELDVCITNTSEWEMWDALRTFYAPNPIPREIQTQCFMRFTLHSKETGVVFNTFTYRDMIRTYIENTIGAEFDVEDYIPDTQEHAINLLETYLPNYNEIIFANPGVLFFDYDTKLKRFVLITSDMELSRGMEHWVREKISTLLPTIYLNASQLWIAEEMMLTEEPDFPKPNLTIQIPSSLETRVEVARDPQEFNSPTHILKQLNMDIDNDQDEPLDEPHLFCRCFC